MAGIFEVVLDIQDETHVNVAYTGTANYIAVPTGVTDVWVWTTTDAFVRVGPGILATTSSFPLPSYTPTRFRIPDSSKSNNRVSAIQVSSNGTLYVGMFQQ